MKKIAYTFKALMFSLRHVLKSREGRIYAFSKFMLALLNELPALLLTTFPGLIINELMDGKRVPRIVIYVLLLTLIPLAVDLIKNASQRFVSRIQNNLNLELNAETYLHKTQVDYELLENPDIRLESDRAYSTFMELNDSVNKFIQFTISAINVIVYSGLIIHYDPIIIGVILVSIVINFLVKKNVRQKIFEERKEFDYYMNKCWGASYIFERYEYGKEIRLFDIGQFLVNRFKKAQRKFDKLSDKQYYQNNTKNNVASITNYSQQLIIYAILIFRILKNTLAVGDLSIGLSAAGQFTGRVRAFLDSYIDLYEDSLKLEEMRTFFERPMRNLNSGKKLPVYDSSSCIEFKNVSFKYPRSDAYALRNVNIKIRSGEKLCIVGENGAGKSTFIKLLTRLYFPTEGEILLNGVNINEYEYKAYMKLFAPVFQDFVEYYSSLKDNVALSENVDTALLDTVMDKVGLKKLVDKLPHGYDTEVSKYIDPEGFEPSGGEAQRIAIARALYHGGEMYLLDEPTAALDPMQEYEIYEKFSEIIDGKSAILITHRLAAVKLADNVAVFCNGGIAEYGTHAELYAKGGIYTEMFDKQAKFYRDEQCRIENANNAN